MTIIDMQGDQTTSSAACLVVDVVSSLLMIARARDGKYLWNVLNEVPDSGESTNIAALEFSLKSARA